MNTSKTKHGASMKRHAEMCELYARLMEEVKYRISGLEQALAGGTMLPGALVREFCFFATPDGNRADFVGVLNGTR
jgi:hypothetical protein